MVNQRVKIFLNSQADRKGRALNCGSGLYFCSPFSHDLKILIDILVGLLPRTKSTYQHGFPLLTDQPIISAQTHESSV